MRICKKVFAVAAALAIAGMMTAGCSIQQETKGRTEGKEEPVTIMVAAAASLEYACTDELIPMFEAAYPSVRVEGTYDSSGKLETQIKEGLEADIFMSAAVKQMDNLVEQSMIDKNSVVDLLNNRIVLITGADLDFGFQEFSDITKASIVALGDPLSVPAGQYAREALESLGVWEEVSKKASFGTNVTEVLTWVAEGSAEAGIVYATDAAATDKVKVIAEAPKGSMKEPAVYPVGIVSISEHKKEAQLFVDFLQSKEALEVFEKYGFTARDFD